MDKRSFCACCLFIPLTQLWTEYTVRRTYYDNVHFTFRKRAAFLKDTAYTILKLDNPIGKRQFLADGLSRLQGGDIGIYLYYLIAPSTLTQHQITWSRRGPPWCGRRRWSRPPLSGGCRTGTRWSSAGLSRRTRGEATLSWWKKPKNVCVNS